MISKKGKTTNVQFAAFKRNLNNKRMAEFISTNPSELTYLRKSIPKQRNSASFLTTGREVKTMSIKGDLGGANPEGVEVGRYTPRYPNKRTPTYTFSKKERDTNLFLFANKTWMKNVNKKFSTNFGDQYRRTKGYGKISIERFNEFNGSQRMRQSLNSTTASNFRPRTAKTRRSSKISSRPRTAKTIKIKKGRKSYRNSSL
mmetsp:Transcript_5595/g.4804  ORF Transcript_5595/g.4804 Transcript_5595/m.4804 type:complete len:201 (+) Transcript_5595:64-666(+)